ncbi:MAG: 16S rRNA (cytosine(1402)-N(4))-methyltransferase, partial [Gammaproteobacteria bacterium]|nr:16S rRNA (cytosine(1402)-N(4))-methyltransferase [Gammaproteobacteria bacterium]
MGTIDAHQPVLFAEALAALVVQPAGCYVDGTFGRGGHSAAILERLGPAGRLLALDKDPEAISQGADLFVGESRLILRHSAFSRLQELIEALGWRGKVDGILLDLGVSSPQLDQPGRGFSFLADGPLDMRMDNSRGTPASTW